MWLLRPKFCFVLDMSEIVLLFRLSWYATKIPILDTYQLCTMDELGHFKTYHSSLL